MAFLTLAPGARVIVRDAEWLVRKVDKTSTGGQALSVVGLSEIVKDREATFLTEVERSIEIIDPIETRYVSDASPHYRDSLLYIESLLRQTPPTDEKLYIGHKAAIDVVPYQLEPAILALEQPRQRILIADGTGLGKTIECGILLTELIKRGRARRILVLTVKSMLTQFQKELWSRFTIPLVRLDSIGIQRLRSRIPSNHNPFYYYDRSIISIDTLKQDSEYRAYLENSSWDVIVIDEAHNVAERGTNSLRSRLARLLASRSDTLIMLSATPHDGKPRAFASIMNMLNPTAIADPDNYTRDDIKGLFIRRFKKDIKSQVAFSFKERRIAVMHAQASPEEEAAFETFARLHFTKLDQKKSGDVLFKTTLEKALFSSPAACLQTIHNRLRTLERADNGYEHDVSALNTLAESVKGVDASSFGKYRILLSAIRDTDHGLAWRPDDPEDRLVIFTERIETLKFLEQHLRADLSLRDEQVRVLHGSLPDVDQDTIVEEFGKRTSPVRLLLASDVASEGINLHYYCHKMIHFDIPWSLMVFQQRNGRIDRYGQEREPRIVYLVTDSGNEKIRGDARILELLIQKDEQAVKNIGDPSALMGVYDIGEEEKITAHAIEIGWSDDEFEQALARAGVDPMAALLGDSPNVGSQAEAAMASMPSLFADDFHFVRNALDHVSRAQKLQSVIDEAGRVITMTAPSELEYRFRYHPKEVWPADGQFLLSDDRTLIEKEMRRCRQEEDAWPRIHLLWEQHPVFTWLNDKILAAFGRQEAPVLTLSDTLADDEVIFLVFGIIPNRQSNPLIHRWFGIRFRGNADAGVLDLDAFLQRTRLGIQQFANRRDPFDEVRLKALAPGTIAIAREWMGEAWKSFESDINSQLDAHLRELERLRDRKFAQLELRFADDTMTPQRLDRKARERREIERLFDEYFTWMEDTMTTENNPYIRIVAVFKGGA